MALRFLLPKIGRRGLSGGELKVMKCPIGLLSGVLSTFQNLRSGGNSSSVRRFCSSSRHTEEDTSDSESDLRPDPSQFRNIHDYGQDNPRYALAGGGNWKMSLQMAEVGEAADLAVKLYNEQQLCVQLKTLFDVLVLKFNPGTCWRLGFILVIRDYLSLALS